MSKRMRKPATHEQLSEPKTTPTKGEIPSARSQHQMYRTAGHKSVEPGRRDHLSGVVMGNMTG